MKVDKLCHSREELETLFVSIEINSISKLLGVTYRPPNSSASNFIASIDSLVLQGAPSSDVLIMGDFNIDLFKDNTEVTEFRSVTSSNGFFPLISRATHLKPGCNPSCIDNIITNSPDICHSSGVIDMSVSHHNPIFVHTLHKGAPSNRNGNATEDDTPSNKKKYYDFCHANISSFQDMVNTTFNMSPYHGSLNDFATVFMDMYGQIFISTEPPKSKRNHGNNPWITHLIVQAIKVREAGNYCWYRIYRPIPPNTAQYRPIPPNTAQYRPIPPNTAQYRPIPPNTAQYRPIPPNTAKYRQIPPNTAKYRQIPPNTAKYRQIPPNTAKYYVFGGI